MCVGGGGAVIHMHAHMQKSATMHSEKGHLHTYL